MRAPAHSVSMTRLRRQPRQHPGKASFGLAMLAIWLQVVFAGLHLASDAHALGDPALGGTALAGTSETESAIWSICTSEGNILSPDGPSGPLKQAEDLCALCLSGIADHLLAADALPLAFAISLPHGRDHVLPRNERAGRPYFSRVGASRAPPLA